MQNIRKILAIGNSFSQNSFQYLYDIAAAHGVRLTLGILYIGGCSLERHVQNTRTDEPAYEYYKNDAGEWNIAPGTPFSAGLSDEDWDLISLQQVSGLAGCPETYGATLDALIGHVQRERRQKDGMLAWNMTWAYQSDSDHADFARYGRDQSTMYGDIVRAVQSEILPRKFDIVVPTGTAVQNARTSSVGDTLTEDGYHLNDPFGRATAALTWFYTLFGISGGQCGLLPPPLWKIADESAQNAVRTPFAVTPSRFR